VINQMAFARVIQWAAMEIIHMGNEVTFSGSHVDRQKRIEAEKQRSEAEKILNG
jgi:hypothetical protein